MSLKLYYDLMSQPSRALYILFKSAKIPFEAVPIALRNGEHFTPEYTKIHPFNKVPAITHNDFALTESVAIAQYLKREKIIPEKYYPSDSKLHARVDEFLMWHQVNVRAPCALYFLLLAIEPMLTGKQPSEKRVESHTKKLYDALDVFETKILGKGNKYVVGDSLTIADLFGACEIEQPRMAGYDPKVGRPNLAAWMDRVRTEFNPYYDEAHQILDKISKKQLAKL